MIIFRAFGAIVENHALRRKIPGAGEAGKISKNLNRRVLTFFMPDKPVELIKIVSLSLKIYRSIPPNRKR